MSERVSYLGFSGGESGLFSSTIVSLGFDALPDLDQNLLAADSLSILTFVARLFLALACLLSLSELVFCWISSPTIFEDE